MPRTYEEAREALRALEARIDTDEDEALRGMAALHPIASQLFAHDVCDAIELWLESRGRRNPRARS